jgi:hypothetical protein
MPSTLRKHTPLVVGLFRKKFKKIFTFGSPTPLIGHPRYARVRFGQKFEKMGLLLAKQVNI